MTTAVQRRRGTTTEHASFTGLEGEISVNTTKETLVVHDGSTAGGFELARADGSNFVATSVDINGGTIDGTTIGASSASTGAFTTLTASGEITANGGIALGDNDKATFGDGDDLQIYHDGSNSVIADAGDGQMYIQGSSLIRLTNVGATEHYAKFNENGGVELRHDNAIKFNTTATGIDVTGTVTADKVGITEGELEGNSGNLQLQSLSTGIIYDAANGFHTFRRNGTNALQINGSTGDISFYEDTGTTPKFFWDASAESLGIGTSSPAAILDVAGAGAEIAIRDTRNTSWTVGDTVASLGFYSNDTSGTSGSTPNLARGAIDLVATSTFGSTHDMVFKTRGDVSTGAVEQLRITSVGNVGIGTSSPAYLLSLEQSSPTLQLKTTNTSGTNTILFSDSASNFVGNIKYNHSDNSLSFATSSSSSERMRIDSSGNLLVGVSSPVGAGSQGVQLSGNGSVLTAKSSADFRTHINFINPNGIVGTISTSGSATAYNTSSDQRLKENIADADDAGSKIDAIQVRKYDWKADGSHQDYGMIAQELQAVAPEAVSGDADSEEMMGVDYSKLVPMLIKEIQSLRNRVAQLETGE